MPVAIEPRRFVKHKVYHIILQEVRKQSLAAAVQIHDVIDKNEHFHLQSTPCANIWTGAKGSNRITLKLVGKFNDLYAISNFVTKFKAHSFIQIINVIANHKHDP